MASVPPLATPSSRLRAPGARWSGASELQKVRGDAFQPAARAGEATPEPRSFRRCAWPSPSPIT
eukprot:2152564-Prymnesium_polylepis.1